MRRTWLMVGLGLVLMILILVACEGYTTTGIKSSTYETTSGGGVRVSINKASGTATQDIELGGYAGVILDAEVTLTVGKGSYKIELLGEDDQVTLSLEARDGETVQGQGWMVSDSFGDAGYRVTAVESENVEYTIEYTFR